MLEIVMFPRFEPKVYPDKLTQSLKGKTDLEIRAEIFPKYINNQPKLEDIVPDSADDWDTFQKACNSLELGEGFTDANEYHYLALVTTSRFLIEDTPNCYKPRGMFETNPIEEMRLGEWLETDQGIFYRNEGDGYIYTYKKEILTALLVEVDTSRPWTIEECDGAEYIDYLDYEVENKKYNYCKKKGV